MLILTTDTRISDVFQSIFFNGIEIVETMTEARELAPYHRIVVIDDNPADGPHFYRNLTHPNIVSLITQEDETNSQKLTSLYDAGIVDYLTKPLQPVVVEKRLNGLLDRITQQEQLHMLKTLSAESPVGFIFLDDQLRIQYTNPTMRELLNHNADWDRGLQGEILDESRHGLSSNDIRHTLESDQPLELEKSGISLAQDQRWSVRYLPLKDGNRLLGVGVIVTDISSQRKIEHRLRRQKAHLQARNAELDAYAYTVAHDLKNPISSMMGSASLIQSYFDRMDRDDVMEQIGFIVESGEKLKEIINALLTLASIDRQKQLDMSPLDMEEIVSSVRHRLDDMIQHKEAEIIMPRDWPRACGYGPWVEEIWTNYISNALKYGGNPPIIELGAENVHGNGHVRFWVRDNGKGIPADKREEIFSQFTRLNRSDGDGYGLGLSIVQRIVDRLGGEVTVNSVEDEGSEFSFTLPKS